MHNIIMNIPLSCKAIVQRYKVETIFVVAINMNNHMNNRIAFCQRTIMFNLQLDYQDDIAFIYDINS